MTWINQTFGSQGVALSFFSNQWWMVGMFLILVFALYLYGARIPKEGLVLFIISALLLAGINNLFDIPQEYQLVIIVPILIFISVILYLVLNR